MAMTAYNPINQWMLPITRPHSAGPYPANHTALAIAGNGESALDYLAGLLSEQRLRNVDEAIVIEDWVLACPELDRRYHDPLEPEEIFDAFHQVLDLVDEHQRRTGQSMVADRLYASLRQALQLDHVRASAGHTNATQASQHLFRALAYVSYRYRSTQLGIVLYRWLSQNLPYIVQYNCRESLWQWCHAILDSSMGQELKHECISVLNMHRPDLFYSSQSGRNQDAVSRLPVRQLSALINQLMAYKRTPSGYGLARRDPWSSSYKSRQPVLTRSHSEELEDERRDLEDQLQRNDDEQRRLDRRYRRSGRSRSRHRSPADY